MLLTMYEFSRYDLLALILFIGAWVAYHFFVERSMTGRRGLNSLMNEARIDWMRQMARREQRMVDSSIIASLQNGTAFFASSSLFAIGGSLALLRAADDVVRVFSDMPFGLVTTRSVWEMKVMGLGIIFGYAFFKFSWAYRLFNYAAIFIGATPQAQDGDTPARERLLMRAAEMNIVAAAHFSRGQRAFFFALAYLGWFVSPFIFGAATLAILYFMWARQFRSAAYRAALANAPFDPADNS